MTGTAYTERKEFKDIYHMDVVRIPTNKPVQRQDKVGLLYTSLQHGHFRRVRRMKSGGVWRRLAGSLLGTRQIYLCGEMCIRDSNSSGDAFITSSETVSEDITTDESNTQPNPLSLTWNGIVSECNEQNVLAEIKKEDGTELSSSAMLILNSINQDAKKEMCIRDSFWLER